MAARIDEHAQRLEPDKHPHGANDQRERLESELANERSKHELSRREWGRALLAVETKLANAENELADLRSTRIEMKQWVAERTEEAEDNEVKRREMEDSLATSEQARIDCEQARIDFENRLRAAEGTIADVTGSLSWRITAPLRVAINAVRRVLGVSRR
jgi:hypothetical protein